MSKAQVGMVAILNHLGLMDHKSLTLNPCTGATGEWLPHLWGTWLILSHRPSSSLPEVCCYWRALGYSSLMTISASAVTALRRRGATLTGWLMPPRDCKLCVSVQLGPGSHYPGAQQGICQHKEGVQSYGCTTPGALTHIPRLGTLAKLLWIEFWWFSFKACSEPIWWYHCSQCSSAPIRMMW
jgi:hypothetical protein